MPNPARLLVLLAAPLFLAACDAGDAAAPTDGPLALQLTIDEGDRTLDVRCGGEDATAHRAAAHLERGQDGHTVLSLALAVSQRRDGLTENCEVHAALPLDTDALVPGTYEIPVTDRGYLLYVREGRDGREVFRFAPLTGRLRLDRVSDDAVAGRLSAHAVTDRGTAAASADFRATLAR